MPHAEDNSPFGKLPPEIFAVIFEFLGIGDKKITRFVCHRWCWICDDQTKFKFSPIIDGNDSVKNLLNTGVTIDNVTFKNLTKADWPYPTLTRNHFPHIKTVTLENGNSDDAILPFLKRFGRGNLECLQLREHSFFKFGIRKMTPVFRDMAWENLSELNFSLNHERANREGENPKDFTKFGSALELFLKLVKAPKLRKLVSEYNELETTMGREEMFKPFFSALVGFISRHSGTLKAFDWTVRFTNRFLADFQNWTIPEELQEIINRDLKLESFSTGFYGWEYIDEPHPPPTLILPLSIWGLKAGLKGFTCRIEEMIPTLLAQHVPSLRFMDQYVLGRIGQTIRRNVETLESVSIPLTSTIQLNNLNNCPNLKKLTLTTYLNTFNDMDVNLNIRLPTVSHLELNAFQSTLPMTLDTWITGVFRDLETIKIDTNLDVPWYQDNPMTRRHWTLSVQMLQNLLQLSKLKTIVEVQGTRIPGEHWFNQHVNGFCARSIDPVLNYQITQSQTYYNHVLGSYSNCPWMTSVAIMVMKP